MPESFGENQKQTNDTKREFPSEVKQFYPWDLANEKPSNLIADQAVQTKVLPAFFNTDYSKTSLSDIPLILSGFKQASYASKIAKLSQNFLTAVKEGSYADPTLPNLKPNIAESVTIGLVAIGNDCGVSDAEKIYTTIASKTLNSYRFLAASLLEKTLEYGLPALAESGSPTDPYSAPEIKKVEVSQLSLTDKLRDLFNNRNKK